MAGLERRRKFENAPRIAKRDIKGKHKENETRKDGKNSRMIRRKIREIKDGKQTKNDHIIA